jgi:hypothetical protein
MISRRLFLLPGLTLCVPLAGCLVAGADSGWVTQSDEKRFPVQGTPKVVLATFDGSIEIQSWNRREVMVTIEKHAASTAAAAAIEVQSSQDGNRVNVEVKRPGAHSWDWFGSGSARLVVLVPEAANVRASSGDGAIRVARVNGTIALRSGDGRIQASNSAGSVSASTGDGGIDLDGVDGAVEAITGDGRVRVSGKITAIRARSGDGSIAIEARPGSATEADWNISSGDGAVTLQIPDDFNAELDAHTGDGSVHLNGVSVTTTGTVTRNSVRGRLGSGGRPVRVRTGDGSITLRRQSSTQ